MAVNKAGSLFVVATPIGNAQDITQRALSILQNVDLVLAEDTRTTRKLLLIQRLTIKAMASLHEHTAETKLNGLIEQLKSGKDMALVSEAGTPGISDPAGRLVRKIREEHGQIRVIPVPGPSAVTTALSVCGFSANRFLFLGFLPKKKRRRKSMERIVVSAETVCFFESPHRILKTMTELALHPQMDPRRKIFIGRELTKKHEAQLFGSVSTIINDLKSEPLRGEFVIVVEGR